MHGPAAPTDPEKMRDSFYIMKDKDIYGAKMDDGRGIQYLYQDCERLVNSAVSFRFIARFLSNPIYSCYAESMISDMEGEMP